MPQWFYKSLQCLACDYLCSKFTNCSYVSSYFLRDISGKLATLATFPVTLLEFHKGKIQFRRDNSLEKTSRQVSHFTIHIAVLDIILIFRYRNSCFTIEKGKVVQFSLNKELMS